MSKSVRALVAVVGIGAVLAGCSQTTSGTAAPSVTGGESGAAGSSSIAPTLDPEPYRSKPCDLVPADLPASLGYTAPGKPDTTSNQAKIGGENCSWILGSRSIQVQVVPQNENANLPGLTKTFQQKDKGYIAYADATDVSGYQAAFADVVDERAKGTCALLVSVSDVETLSARADRYSGPQDSCDTAKQLATAMIKTLQGN